MAKDKPAITAIWIYLSASYAHERAATVIRRHFTRAYPNEPLLAHLAARFPITLMCGVRVQPGFDLGPVTVDFDGLAEEHFGPHPNASAWAMEAMIAWKGPDLQSESGFYLDLSPDGTAKINWPALGARHSEVAAELFSKIQSDNAKKDRPSRRKPTGSQPEANRLVTGYEPATSHELAFIQSDSQSVRQSIPPDPPEPEPESKPSPTATPPEGGGRVINKNDPAIGFLIADLTRVVGPPDDPKEETATRKYFAQLLLQHKAPEITAAIETYPDHCGSLAWSSVRKFLATILKTGKGPNDWAAEKAAQPRIVGDFMEYPKL